MGSGCDGWSEVIGRSDDVVGLWCLRVLGWLSGAGLSVAGW
jgi:hypothetical protein